MPSRYPGLPRPTQASAQPSVLLLQGFSLGKNVGTLNRCLVTSVLPADWDIQVHESSFPNKQFFSICCSHRVSWASEICEYKRKRQGRLRRGWVQVQEGSRVPGAQGLLLCSLPGLPPGGKAFEVTDHQ